MNAKNNRTRSRRSRAGLRLESLERREVLTTVGLDPMPPELAFNVDGAVTYDSASDSLTVDATPTLFAASDGATPTFFFGGDLDVSILVDDAGALSGGAPGDDLVLTGDLDIDGDFIVDFSGTLLTGEVTSFASLDGSPTDIYEFTFTVTGGQLASLYDGADLGMTVSSEPSTFAGDFTTDFTGAAKGELGAIPPVIDPGGDSPAIEIQKLTNGVDADTVAEAVEIAAGEAITVTYLVTNTGDVAFDLADIVVSDDNGTPGDASDDFSTTTGDIVFDASSDNGDGVLSPGETFTYTYDTVAADLTTTGPTTVIDFEGFAAGTVIDDELSSLGLTVSSQDQTDHPAMIFDTLNPTGGDFDLATPGTGIGNDTPLGNVLIISEDADSSDPDDDAKGGTLTFTWDEAVTVDTVTMLDIDRNEPGGNVALFFDASGGLIASIEIPALGDGSVQTLDVNVTGVTRMDVNLVSSGAVAELVFTEIEEGFFLNTAFATAPGAEVATDTSSYVNPEPPAPVVVADPKTELLDDGYTQNGKGKDNGLLRVENSTKRERVSYLKFEVSDLQGQGVEEALLELTVHRDSGHGTISIFRAVDSDWDENSLNGSNAPEAGELLDSVSGSFDKGDKVTFDVTDGIDGDGVVTFIIMISDDSNDVAFAAGEGRDSRDPVLYVTADGTYASDEAFAAL